MGAKKYKMSKESRRFRERMYKADLRIEKEYFKNLKKIMKAQTKVIIAFAEQKNLDKALARLDKIYAENEWLFDSWDIDIKNHNEEIINIFNDSFFERPKFFIVEQAEEIRVLRQIAEKDKIIAEYQRKFGALSLN